MYVAPKEFQKMTCFGENTTVVVCILEEIVLFYLTSHVVIVR